MSSNQLMTLVFVALGLMLTGGALALVTTRRPGLSSLLGTIGAVAGGAVGLFPAAQALVMKEPITVNVAGEALFGGTLAVGLDPLSGFFLVPVFALGGLGALYGREYMSAWAGKRWLGPPWLAYDVLLASIAGVIIARDAITIVFSVEIMSLAAFVLVTFEHEIASTRRAGWVYLIASHVAVAALLAMFLLFGREAGGLDFASMSAAKLKTGTATTIFWLTLIGFGTKGGLVPLHVWLPEAHAAAPSHVSAVMSGVLIKTGIYGIIRVVTMLGAPAPWWGPLLMVIGLGGGIFGIAVALYQRDMKRVLAYSSVENVGIIALGIGLGIWGIHIKSLHVAALGFTGGLLHVWNHALMKGLLFLGAGSVLHGSGTKDLARLGGLMKQMPKTGALFIVGAVAISALPPLNGFVGEWLIYAGLVDGAQHRAHTAASITALLAVGFFGMMGALAALAFVRLVGTAFLGAARTPDVGHAHESPSAMIAPMAALATLCVMVAILPAAIVGRLSVVVAQVLGPAVSSSTTFDLAATLGLPLETLGIVNAVIWTGIVVVGLVLRALLLRNGSTTSETWGCGYLAPSPRMQYVPGSFSELFAEHILPQVFRARIRQATKQSIFEPKTKLAADLADPLTRGVYEPFLARWADRLSRVRWLQQGHIHVYLLYILVVVLAGLAWMSVRRWSW